MASKLAEDDPNLFQIQTISMKPISSPEYEERSSNRSQKHQRSNSKGSSSSPLSKKQKALFEKSAGSSKKRSGSNGRNSVSQDLKPIENQPESHLARQRYLDRHANCQHSSSREQSPTSSAHTRNKSNRSSAKQLSERPSTGRSSHRSHQSSSSEQNHSPSQRRKHKKRASASSLGSWRENLSRVSLAKEQEEQNKHEPIPEETPTRGEKIRHSSRLKNSTR